jgi:hypothetical protein
MRHYGLKIRRLSDAGTEGISNIQIKQLILLPFKSK